MYKYSRSSRLAANLVESGPDPMQRRLDPSIYEALQKEGVAVGDVVYVEANSGAVKRVGRSDAYATVSCSYF